MSIYSKFKFILCLRSSIMHSLRSNSCTMTWMTNGSTKLRGAKYWPAIRCHHFISFQSCTSGRSSSAYFGQGSSENLHVHGRRPKSTQISAGPSMRSFAIRAGPMSISNRIKGIRQKGWSKHLSQPTSGHQMMAAIDSFSRDKTQLANWLVVKWSDTPG